MKLEAIVKVESGVAHFNLSSERQGVYTAYLEKFSGAPEAAPPQRILLTRGATRWVGSCEDRELLNELGQIIERVVYEAPIFRRNEDSIRDPNKTSSPEQ